jgi:hypothetical protein
MKDSEKDKQSSQLESEKEFLDIVKNQLNESEQKLSADDLRSLRLARAKAVESLDRNRQGNVRRYWQPVAGFAAAASVVAIVVGLQEIQTVSVDPSDTDVANTKGAYTLGAQSVEDLPLLGAAEELEFYENLEFYQWLEFQEQTG